MSNLLVISQQLKSFKFRIIKNGIPVCSKHSVESPMLTIGLDFIIELVYFVGYFQKFLLVITAHDVVHIDHVNLHLPDNSLHYRIERRFQ